MRFNRSFVTGGKAARLRGPVQRAVANCAALGCLAAATIAILPVVLGPDAMAQSSGTFATPSGPTARAPASARPEDIIEDAQDALDRGRVLEARRLLEAVIERFPKARAADEARTLLAPIYAADGRQQQRQQAPGLVQPRDTADAPQAQLRRVPEFERNAVRDAATPGQNGSGVARAQGQGGRAFDPRQLRYVIQDFRTNVADRVFFGESSAEIGSRSRLVLATQAHWFNRNPSLLVVLEAHADDQPATRDANLEIARRRADAVRSRLIEEGIDPDRIRISIRGRESPVAACPDPACAAQNRRVVTLVGDPALDRSMPLISGPVGR